MSDNELPRYWLLTGHEFYPDMGWYDFDRAFDTIEEARKRAEYGRDDDGFLERNEWAQIINRETMRVVLVGFIHRYSWGTAHEDAKWEWEEPDDSAS